MNEKPQVLLCLLSEQHVPNLLSVHHFKPDHLVLVVTKGMQDKVEPFLKALSLGKLDYRDRYEKYLVQQEDSPVAMSQTLKEVHDRHPDAAFLVNLTGGTKPMAMGAYRFFKEQVPGARLLYINANRPNEILDLDKNDLPGEQCAHRVLVEQFVAGYGYQVRESKDKIAKRARQDEALWEAARRLALEPPAKPLLTPDGDKEQQRKNWKQAREQGLELQSGWLVPPAPARAALAQALGLREEGESLLGWLSNDGGRLVTGGWLEVFVAGLLRRLPEEEVWDVARDIHVEKSGEPNTDNELDVVFMARQQLHVVECKTGDQGEERLQDALYKLEAVLSRMRALGVKLRLATTGKVDDGLRRRAEIYRCQLVEPAKLKELAQNPEDLQLIHKAFL